MSCTHRKSVGDLEHAVAIRRASSGCCISSVSWILMLIAHSGFSPQPLNALMRHASIPHGIADPLNIDGKLIHIHSSPSRGCKALNVDGVSTVPTNADMTLGPTIDFTSIIMAVEASSILEIRLCHQGCPLNCGPWPERWRLACIIVTAVMAGEPSVLLMLDISCVHPLYITALRPTLRCHRGPRPPE